MSEKPWGGRFKESTSLAVEAYTESISFDSVLYAQDIAGSKAHARMLGEQGIITREEATMIFYRLLDAESRAKFETSACTFADVAASRWSRTAIATMSNAGIITGTELSNGTTVYYGVNAITRAEMAVIVWRINNYS